MTAKICKTLYVWFTTVSYISSPRAHLQDVLFSLFSALGFIAAGVAIAVFADPFHLVVFGVRILNPGFRGMVAAAVSRVRGDGGCSSE